MMVAGLGCRRNVEAGEIVAALDAVLAQHGLGRDGLDALATVPLKRDEAGLLEAASLLGLPLLVPAATDLLDAEDRALSNSGRSMAATGTASASEVAALAAAGPGSRLLGARQVHGGVTCAIAVGGDEP